MKKPEPPAHFDPVAALLRLPRLARILIVSVATLLATFSLSYITAELHLRYFFSIETLALPWYLTVAAAVVLYLIGWVLVIGMAGSNPTPRPAVYVYAGGLLVILVGGLVWMLANALPVLLD